MSLRFRLILVISILFLLGMFAVLGRSLLAAREEISNDIELSRQIIEQFTGLLTTQHVAGNEQQFISVLTVQLQQLETAGKFHTDIYFGSYSPDVISGIDQQALTAPLWFLDVLGIDESRLIVTRELIPGRPLIVHLDPAEQINDIWNELTFISTLRLSALGIILLVICLLITYWLQPIAGIIPVLDQLVKGDYSRRIPQIYLPEISVVAQKINNLAAALGASKSDNERLTRQAMSVQEQERHYLTQELHDSLGQAVSAIKAMAVSIANRTRTQIPDIAESADNIEKISDDAYRSVRNLLTWLRPAVLDELGLTLALQQMVDGWNVHHEDTFCSLRIDCDLAELKEYQQIQLYRIVQEGLTNVAKHARAGRVNVVVSGQEVITLMISDDGKGFDTNHVRMGTGLTNIRDRSNLLQGNLVVTSSPGKGTTLQIEFPRGQRFRRRREDRE